MYAIAHQSRGHRVNFIDAAQAHRDLEGRRTHGSTVMTH
jgi:hypothetical protein